MDSFTRFCNYVGSGSEPSSGIARITRSGEEPANHGPLIRQGPPLAERILLIDNVKLESISCELCHQIFEEPTVAGMCGHCFCKPCLVIYKSTKSSQGCPTCGAKISKSSGLPNRSLSTIIDSQRRFCVSRYIYDCSSKKYVELQDGCMFVGSSDQLVEHEVACPMMPVECPQRSCKRLVLRKDLEEHRKAQCWLQCEQCGLDIQIGLQEKHLKDECPETKFGCPRSDIGCHIVLKRRAQGKHLESCPYERYRMDIEALRQSLRDKEEEIARLRGKTEPTGGDRKRELNGVSSDEETPSKRAKTREVQVWKFTEQHEHVAVSPDNGEQPGDVRKLLTHMVGSVEGVLLSGMNKITARIHKCEAKVTDLEALFQQRESGREGLSSYEVTAKATGKHMVTEGASKARDETAGQTRTEVKTVPNGSLAAEKVEEPVRSTGRVIVFKKGRSAETEGAAGTQGPKKLRSDEVPSVLKVVKKEPFTAVEQDPGKERAEGNGNGSQLREVKKERSPSMARTLGGRTSEERVVPGRTESERKAGRSLEGRLERAKSEQRSNRDGKTDRDLERREESKPRWRLGQVGHREYDRRPAHELEQEQGRERRVRHDVHRRLEEPGSASSGFHVASHEHGQHAEASSPKVDRDFPAHPSIRCLSFWFRAIDVVSRMLSHPTPTQGRFISSVVGILQEMQQGQDFRALFQPSSNLEMLEALRQLDERVQCLIDGRVDYSPEATRAWNMAMDSIPEGVLVYDNWSLIKLEKFVMNKQGGMKYDRRFNDELRRAIEQEKQKPNLPLKQSVLLNSNDVSPSGSDSRPPGFQDRVPFQPPERPFLDRVGPRPGGRFDPPNRDFRRPRDMSPTPSFRPSVKDRILDPRDTRRQNDAGSFVNRRSPRYSVFDLDM
ncbi:putative traf-type zinc finger family protein [Klebsormidium nitens]|uniref:Putative traf-type zinc finger family protein n=1 Tax=Klebsormidium nitens TaxID=105231 RepID=A0A1Y1IAZ5_KLENI|nr:putative traf-type zinc finger family protein [Klebsormidium nitens]|eukprot:GAQ85866.1 putative traf-type zinc finger family protein [Klebsormidium nitens]